MRGIGSTRQKGLSFIAPAILLLTFAGCGDDSGQRGGHRCTITAECNDGDPCTVDACTSGGRCDNAPITCSSLDDGCRLGVCDPRTGSCVAEVRLDAACDDRDPCTSDDRCDLAGQCAGTWDCPCETDDDCSGEPEPCRRMVCVGRACVAQADPSLDGSACDDGAYCTVGDTCRNGSCVSGAERTCPSDDPDPCSGAVCDEVTDACVSAPRAGTRCDDGDACTRDDTCDGEGVCSGAPVACPPPDGPCRESVCSNGLCVSQARTDAPCDDGDNCTLADACSPAGICEGTWDEDGDENGCGCSTDGDCAGLGDACSTGRCEASSRRCERVPRTGTTCDDGDPCTRGDTCSDQGACVGVAYACDDQLSCTDDRCDGAGGCSHDLTTGTCLIAGTCRAPGSQNPANPCEVCAGGEAWTAAPATTPCDDADPCTHDDHCALGRCGGEPVACAPLADCQTMRCDGGGGCSVETIEGYCAIDGGCIAAGTPKPGDPCRACVPAESPDGWSVVDGAACDDGDPCTTGDSCSQGDCTGAAYDCDDGAACSDDVCDGAGGCSHEVQPGKCLIDGECYADHAASPTGACRRCEVGVSQVGWSASPAASPCDDGLACTAGDACDGAGQCVGSLSGCVYDAACESAACGGDGCAITLKAGFCKIAGSCWSEGSQDPQNPCRVCASASSTSAWSARQGGCDDGDACTRDDTCDGGQCGGTPSPCDDGRACTTDACDGAGGCTTALVPGTCLIDGACYAQGDPDPANPCRTCNPSAATGAWSVAPAGTPCDSDGLDCTLDVCSGTACLHPQVSGCLIGGKCYQEGDPNPTNSCEVCQGGTSFSARPVDSACISDGEPCTQDRCDANRICRHAPLADETPCDDGDASSVGDWCTEGVCTGFVRATTGPEGLAYVDAATFSLPGTGRAAPYAIYVDANGLQADHFSGSLTPTRNSVDFARGSQHATSKYLTSGPYLLAWDGSAWAGVYGGGPGDLTYELRQLPEMQIAAVTASVFGYGDAVFATGLVDGKATTHFCAEEGLTSSEPFAGYLATNVRPTLIASDDYDYRPRIVGRWGDLLALFEWSSETSAWDVTGDFWNTAATERAALRVQERVVVVGDDGLFIVEKAGADGFTSIAVPGWWAQSTVDFVGIERFAGRIFVIGQQTEGSTRTLHLVVRTEGDDPGASSSWRPHNLGATQASQVGGTLDNATVNAMAVASDGVYLFGRWWNASAGRGEKAVWRWAP